jgi:hypothetical protein
MTQLFPELLERVERLERALDGDQAFPNKAFIGAGGVEEPPSGLTKAEVEAIVAAAGLTAKQLHEIETHLFKELTIEGLVGLVELMVSGPLSVKALSLLTLTPLTIEANGVLVPTGTLCTVKPTIAGIEVFGSKMPPLGIVGGQPLLIIANEGPEALTLKHENIGAAAIERFSFAGGADLVLAVKQMVVLVKVLARWRNSH